MESLRRELRSIQNRCKGWRAYLQTCSVGTRVGFAPAAVQRGQLSGDAGLEDEAATLAGRRVEFGGRGRPGAAGK